MRGLFYCQPVLGLGHLLRSIYISKSLVNFFEVDFLHGGYKMIETPPLKRFYFLQLPPIWLKDPTDLSRLEDPYGKHSLQEIFELRWKKLEPLFENPYDFIITEMYPFSKKTFAKEIDTLIQKVKKRNPSCLVICSFRGVYDPLPPEREIEIVKKIFEEYDYVFSHSDERLIPLDDFFQMASAIKQKLIYTGFVSNPEEFKAVRKKQIVITMGAGSYGEELPRIVATIAPLFPDYTFLFGLGPKTPPNLRKSLEERSVSNIKITGFIDNFCQVLSESALSISLGGSTLGDVVKTKTPALVYPERNLEHLLRAKKFEEKGAVKVLRKEDLTLSGLKKIMEEVLHAPYRDPDIDVNGAQNTALAITKLIKMGPPNRSV